MSTSTANQSSAGFSTGESNIRVYNTLSRTKEPFQTIVPGKVGIYLCGPTVYKEAHIGHMVGPVIFDTIKRFLVYCGYEVTWVVNITDVDDKLIAESSRRGISMADVAEEMTADYLKNLNLLGVDQIDHLPKATESMDDIVAMIAELIAKGFAYESQGDVYFEVAKDAEYGKLTNRSPDEQQGDGGDTASRKRATADFALWKRAKSEEPSWDSPWGKGRPGWHIECSAMSRGLLGESFDIHGGGLDLVFPHHENEIAQSECCHGKPMARYWMHNGLMRAASSAAKLGGRSDRASDDDQATVEMKISRSKGAGGLAELIDQRGGEVIRFFLLRSHYRSTIVFGDEGLDEASTALDAFYRLFERFERVTSKSFYSLVPMRRRQDGEITVGDDALLRETATLRTDFLAKLDDDFNTGAAIGDLFELIRAINKHADQHNLDGAGKASPQAAQPWTRAVAVLRELTALLGLFAEPPQAAGGDDAMVSNLLDLLVELRNSARQNKDFATSDRIRDALAEFGVILEDRKEGTGWRIE